MLLPVCQKIKLKQVGSLGLRRDMVESGRPSPGSCFRPMQVQSLGWNDPLEENMATHSSILAWRIPLTHWLQSIELQCKQSDTSEAIQHTTQVHFLLARGKPLTPPVQCPLQHGGYEKIPGPRLFPCRTPQAREKKLFPVSILGSQTL